MTLRSEKLGRTKSSKRKQPGLEEGGERERERRVQRNDLWRSDSLAVSAAAQKPNRADTDTTDTHGQMKAPPRAMKVTPCDVDNGSR